MLQLLARRWWALALRGVIAVLFGLLTFFIPGVTLISLVLLFGFYAILDGIFDIVSAIKAPGHHWPLLVEGIVGIVAGIVTFMWPGITAMFLLYLIAFWAILTGVLLQHEYLAKAFPKAPKDRDGKVPDIRNWDLVHLIVVAVGLRLINPGVERLSHSIREYRYLVHPIVEIKTALRVDAEEAKIAVEVLNMIHRELAK